MDFTRTELEAEIKEKSEDLQALLRSRDILFGRCVEVRDNSKSRLMKFSEWAGSHALMNTFDLVINSATRILEELKELRDNTQEPPRLRIVKDDEQGTPES